MTWFIVGFGSGAVVFWQVSKYLERFRRARRDFRVARAGIRTLIEMMFRRGAEAVLWAAVGATVVVGLIWMTTKGH